MKNYIQEMQLRWALLPKSNRIGIIVCSIVVVIAFFVGVTWIHVSNSKDQKYEKTISDLQSSETYYKQKVAAAEEKIENLDAQVEVLLTKLKSTSVEREKADNAAIIQREKSKKSGEIYEQNKKSTNPAPARSNDSIISDDELCANAIKAGRKPVWCK